MGPPPGERERRPEHVSESHRWRRKRDQHDLQRPDEQEHCSEHQVLIGAAESSAQTAHEASVGPSSLTVVRLWADPPTTTG
jgi:hypothetical protein